MIMESGHGSRSCCEGVAGQDPGMHARHTWPGAIEFQCASVHRAGLDGFVSRCMHHHISCGILVMARGMHQHISYGILVMARGMH